jgi:hypothetical protein
MIIMQPRLAHLAPNPPYASTSTASYGYWMVLIPRYVVLHSDHNEYPLPSRASPTGHPTLGDPRPHLDIHVKLTKLVSLIWSARLYNNHIKAT